MKKTNYIKEKVKYIIDEKIRFSMKSRITLSYSITYIFISVLTTMGVLFLLHENINNLDPNIYVSLLTILVSVKVFEVIFVIIFSYRTSKKFLKPVDIMINEVKEISINDLDKRLDVSGIKNEYKDLAKTFNKMLDEIQYSVEKQNQFVSDASHELRTPISVVQGYANLLDRWGKDEREVLEESITAIKDEAENMKKLIESLLFLARGDRNKQIIEKENFDLKDLINELVKESIMIDEKHNIRNTNNEDVAIYGDRNLIKEAMRIFIDNSMKYTQDEGTIKIDTFPCKKGVYIVIEDNGIGIGEEDLPNIFNRFYRSDKSRNKQSGGTGLGLSIAKFIIDSHNGEIKVYSKLNEGTITSILIPIEEKK